MMTNIKTGVLLMAHGAPESLNDIPPYLSHIMRGHEPSQEIIAQIRERYRLVGGKSPLLKITRDLAVKLEKHLNKGGDCFQVYVGMRHWHPFIHETIVQILKDPMDRLLAISLAPQYSRMSVGAYNHALDMALGDVKEKLLVQTVSSWHSEPLLLDAFSEHLKECLALYSEKRRPEVKILFTAHSLPAEILKDGDPYPREVRATVKGIVDRLKLGLEGQRWQFAYQSKGFRGGDWLGPQAEDMIDHLANLGVRDLLVAPIGFVSDHVEILYDIDIFYKGLAASKGIQLKRIPSLNSSESLVKTLASVIRKNVED